jgi:hypothetical protein
VLGARQGLKFAFSIFKSLNGGFRAAFLLRTMEKMLFLVRHSSAFGALPLEKLIEERRFICALCESLIQRMATSFLLTIVSWSGFNFHADNQGVLLLSNF